MPKFLIRAQYTAQALEGYVREGFAPRREEAAAMFARAGGSVDCSYFTSGGEEIILIVDMPDAESLNAVNLAGNVSGAARGTSTRLFTLEEMDDAAKRMPAYRHPGH